MLWSIKASPATVYKWYVISDMRDYPGVSLSQTVSIKISGKRFIFNAPRSSSF